MRGCTVVRLGSIDVECLFRHITVHYEPSYILRRELLLTLHVVLPVPVGHLGHLDQGVRRVGSHLPPPRSPIARRP